MTTSQGAPEAGAWVQYPDGSIWSSDGTRCAVSACAPATCGRAGDYYECAGVASKVKLSIIPEVLEALNRRATSPSPHPGVGATWRDESMAMHWIDRYASGIDHEPQMSRILACVATPPVGVEVVKLEWEEEEHEPNWWCASHAETLLGYELRVTGAGKVRVRNPEQGGWSDFDGDIEAAKTAAQVDFERRIRSALVPSAEASLLKEAQHLPATEATGFSAK